MSDIVGPLNLGVSEDLAEERLAHGSRHPHRLGPLARRGSSGFRLTALTLLDDGPHPRNGWPRLRHVVLEPGPVFDQL